MLTMPKHKPSSGINKQSPDIVSVPSQFHVLRTCPGIPNTNNLYQTSRKSIRKGPNKMAVKGSHACSWKWIVQYLFSTTRDKQCPCIIHIQCINWILMTFGSNWTVPMWFSVGRNNVATRIYIAQGWQSRSRVSVRNLILFCIYRFGYRCNSSIKIPYEDLTTKATRGYNIALQWRHKKHIKYSRYRTNTST